VADIEQALYTRLTGFAGLAALVSTRVTPMALGQNLQDIAAFLDSLTYQKVSGTRLHSYGADPGVVTARFQIDSWARSYAKAKAVAFQVRAALANQYGTTWSAVVIQNCRLENEIDDMDAETGIYRVTQDFTITYEE
jgi:hypothetical protein